MSLLLLDAQRVDDFAEDPRSTDELEVSDGVDEIPDDEESNTDEDDESRIGLDFQAELPPLAPGEDDPVRPDSLLWVPASVEGADAFLARCKLGEDATKRSPAKEEAALETWHAHGGGRDDPEAPLAAIKVSLLRRQVTQLAPEEVSLLCQALQLCGNDMRAVQRALAPMVERPVSALVEAYYLHHFVPMGFMEDDMRFAAVAQRHRPREKKANTCGANLHSPSSRRRPQFAVPKSLSEMLELGILAPGESVLCAHNRHGEMRFADLLWSGLIRFDDPAGGGTLLLKTPAMFARAATVRATARYSMPRSRPCSNICIPPPPCPMVRLRSYLPTRPLCWTRLELDLT